MTDTIRMSLALAILLVVVDPVWSQDPRSDVQEKAQQSLDNAREKAGEVAEAVDKSKQAQDASVGILRPIYQLAEAFSFPAFHWIAFAVMVAGVVSFALQLTLGKLVVLASRGFSAAEILSDALGLVVSLVGLVLTTQAAAENSSFTKSAARSPLRYCHWRDRGLCLLRLGTKTGATGRRRSKKSGRNGEPESELVDAATGKSVTWRADSGNRLPRSGRSPQTPRIHRLSTRTGR